MGRNQTVINQTFIKCSIPNVRLKLMTQKLRVACSTAEPARHPWILFDIKMCVHIKSFDRKSCKNLVKILAPKFLSNYFKSFGWQCLQKCKSVIKHTLWVFWLRSRNWFSLNSKWATSYQIVYYLNICIYFQYGNSLFDWLSLRIPKVWARLGGPVG